MLADGLRGLADPFPVHQGERREDRVPVGTVQGVMLYGCPLSWFMKIFGPAAVALWMIVALFGGLACGLIGWAERRHPQMKWLPLHAALVWTAVEYLRSEWFWLRFPWMTPGLALGPTWLLTVHRGLWDRLSRGTEWNAGGV